MTSQPDILEFRPRPTLRPLEAISTRTQRQSKLDLKRIKDAALEVAYAIARRFGTPSLLASVKAATGTSTIEVVLAALDRQLPLPNGWTHADLANLLIVASGTTEEKMLAPFLVASGRLKSDHLRVRAYIGGERCFRGSEWKAGVNGACLTISAQHLIHGFPSDYHLSFEPFWTEERASREVNLEAHGQAHFTCKFQMQRDSARRSSRSACRVGMMEVENYLIRRNPFRVADSAVMEVVKGTGRGLAAGA